jgi:hypothetical protein
MALTILLFINLHLTRQIRIGYANQNAVEIGDIIDSTRRRLMRKAGIASRILAFGVRGLYSR